MTTQKAYRAVPPILLPILAMGQGSDYFPGPSQSQVDDGAPLITFETIFIESGDSTENRSIRMSQETGTFQATNVTLEDLVAFAYSIDHSKISGGPDWAYTAGYSIQAQAPVLDQEIHMNRAERVMIRGMLWDLFKVDLDPITEWYFSLIVDERTGPKFHESAANSDGESGLHYEEVSNDQLGAAYRRQGQIIGRRATMSALADFMGEFEGGPVVDRTGLPGEYDFALSWTRRWSGYVERRDRLREEMGLLLRRVPVQRFVIESAQRPDTN